MGRILQPIEAVLGMALLLAPDQSRWHHRSAQQFLEKEVVMEFLSVYPVILGYCRKAFRGHHDGEELTAEAVAVAFLGWRSLQRRGKTVSPLSVAFYAVRRARSGRKVCTSDCKRDAFNLPRCTEPDVVDHLAGDDDPAEEAALRIDFPAYIAIQPKMKRQACRMFLRGEPTKVVARRLRVSRGRVSQVRRELVEGWASYTE